MTYTPNFNARNCTYAGSCTFCGNSDFTTLNIGDNVTIIPSELFFDCEGITTVTIPNSVTHIGSGAFNHCTSLSTLFLSESMTAITDYTFGDCSNLTSVIIPTSVVSIGEGAFCRCGLTTFTIPDSVTSIGNYAFYGCSNLTSISIPNSVTTIGDEVLTLCDRLSSPVYNNVFFVKLPISYSGIYAIPDGIHTLCGSAFRNCTYLTSVTMPNSVTDIGSGAFNGCTILHSVDISDSVENIGRWAFFNSGISGELVIPAKVNHIGFMGFANCTGITGITCLGPEAPTLELESLFLEEGLCFAEVFEGVDSNISVRIPCGARESYMEYWTYFSNIIETPFVVLTNNPEQGNIVYIQGPTCNNPTAIVRAVAEAGFHFDHWSDGSRENPYTYTPIVKNDMILIAYFAPGEAPNGIEDADGEAVGPTVYADGGRIVVTGAEDEEVCLYDMMGRLLATRQGEDIHFDVPAAGAYLVRIGNHPARRIVVVR